MEQVVLCNDARCPAKDKRGMQASEVDQHLPKFVAPVMDPSVGSGRVPHLRVRCAVRA